MYCISDPPRPHDGSSCNGRPVLHLQQRERAGGEREREPKGSSGAGQPPAADIHADAAAWWWEVSWWMGTYRLWSKVRALHIIMQCFGDSSHFKLIVWCRFRKLRGCSHRMSFCVKKCKTQVSEMKGTGSWIAFFKARTYSGMQKLFCKQFLNCVIIFYFLVIFITI